MEQRTALVDNDATTPSNRHELKARGAKAAKLAEVLLGHGASADEVAELPRSSQRITAALAGVRPASAATWQLVVELVACVERGRALAPLAERLDDEALFGRL